LWSLYLSPKKVKANRIPPDRAFLADMDDEKNGWRAQLAKVIKKLNPDANSALITATVQLWIDRLRLVELVTAMLGLKQRQAHAKTKVEQDKCQRQIYAVDREIDELVYQLYGWIRLTSNIGIPFPAAPQNGTHAIKRAPGESRKISFKPG
jgi:hypothetical protein